MPVEHGFRPRPVGQVNLSPDGVGGSGGQGYMSMEVMPMLAQLNRENPPQDYYLGSSSKTLAGYMFSRLVKIENDVKLYGTQQQRDAARKVKLSYLALALPFMYPKGKEDLRELVMLSHYEPIREEQDAPGIELSFTQVKTLQFALDAAGVPIKLGDAPLCILLHPLEQVMQSEELRVRMRDRLPDELRLKPWQLKIKEKAREHDPNKGAVIDFMVQKDKRRTQP